MDIVKASVFLLDTLTLEACYVRGRSIGTISLLLSFVLKLGGITGIRACKVSSELSVVPSPKVIYHTALVVLGHTNIL